MQRVDRLGAIPAGSHPRAPISADDRAVDRRRQHGPTGRVPGRAGGSGCPAARARARPRDAGRRPPLSARRPGPRTPRPASASNSVAASGSMPRSPGSGDDRTRQRMLGIGLDRGRETEQVGSASPAAVATPATTGRPRVSVPVLSKITTSRSRARSRASRSLTSSPLLRPERGADRDHQRDGQAEGVRTGDHQDRRRPDQRPLRIAGDPPVDERDGRRSERHVEEDGRRPVRQRLGPRRRTPARPPRGA